MADRYPCADCERPMLSQPIYTGPLSEAEVARLRAMVGAA